MNVYSNYYTIVQYHYQYLSYMFKISFPSSQPNNIQDYKRQKLINATIKTISDYGLSKTTVSRVTKAAKMSAGIVGFYFDSKEKLLLSTLHYINEEFKAKTQAAFSSSLNSAESLKAVVNVYFDPQLCDVEKIAVWYAFFSESSARKEYMEICGEQDQWFHENIVERVQSLCLDHGIPIQRAEAISRGLAGMMESFWQEYLYQPDQFDSEASINLCHDYLKVVFPKAYQDSGEALKQASEFSGIPSDALDDSLPDSLSSDLSDCLAPWTYFDEELLELEKNELFKKNWLLVGHVNDMPNPRDFLTFDAIGERAIVIRGNDNKVRAFHNVCRHRGAKLMSSPSGQCSHALTCPFHGWTYQLDGTLIGVPAENTFENLEKNKNGLVQIDMEIWMGFIFIRFVSSGDSLKQQMQAVEADFMDYNLEFVEPLKNSYFSEVVPYNWKVVHDIDNEGYHVPIGHPSLQQLYGQNYKDSFVNDISVSHAYINDKPGKLWSVKHYQKLLPEFDHLPADKQKLWYYSTVFPSMVFGLYPDSMEFYMTLPIDAETTIIRGGAYALADDRKEMKASTLS